MSQPTFNTYGAVDLGALAARANQPSSRPAGSAASAGTAGPGATSGAGTYVVDATEETFAELVAQSETVPVVLDFWASWCGPCKQLSPILERLAAEGAGRWLLAKIDADAEQRLAAAFRVQSIPSVFAVVRGQPVPLFQGALPEAQVRAYLDELLRLAEANGVNGRVDDAAPPAEPDGAASAVPQVPQGDPRLDAAYDAAEAGDFATASQAFRAVLAESPGHEEATAGLAQVELLQRVGDVDPAAELSAAAAADPGDVDAAMRAADVEMSQGRAEEAMARLVEAVRRSGGSDREVARARLLEYFTMLGPEDVRVVTARRALARALF